MLMGAFAVTGGFKCYPISNLKRFAIFTPGKNKCNEKVSVDSYTHFCSGCLFADNLFCNRFKSTQCGGAGNTFNGH